MPDRNGQAQAQPTPGNPAWLDSQLQYRARAESTLLDQYAAANQACRDIAAQVGVRHCDEDPQWRAAEREAETLWKQARAAGHTVEEILAAGRSKGGHS